MLPLSLGQFSEMPNTWLRSVTNSLFIIQGTLDVFVFAPKELGLPQPRILAINTLISAFY